MPLGAFSIVGKPSSNVSALVASGRPFTRMLFALRVGNVILPVAFGGITTVHSITPSVIFHDDDAVP